MHDPSGDHGAAELLACELVDVTKLPLAELLSSDDRTLQAAVRNLMTELDAPREVVASWNNFLP